MIDSSEALNEPAGWFADPWQAGQLRYFDGRRWTGEVMRVAGSGVTQQAAGAFPLGESVLLLLAIPDARDIDVACSVQSGQGHPLAVIRPRSRMSVLSSDVDDLVFDVVRADGAPVLTITRSGGFLKQHLMHVYDGAGQHLGRLRQTSSSWRRLRGSKVSMTLEYAAGELGYADVCIHPRSRFLEVDEPIHDVAGVPVGAVHRKWRYGETNDFFDYRLECFRPTPSPLPALLLVTAFAHYLYDRLAVGGPFASYNRFGRGGTWQDARR